MTQKVAIRGDDVNLKSSALEDPALRGLTLGERRVGVASGGTFLGEHTYLHCTALQDMC